MRRRTLAIRENHSVHREIHSCDQAAGVTSSRGSTAFFVRGYQRLCAFASRCIPGPESYRALSGIREARPCKQVLTALNGVPSTSTVSPPKFQTARGAENYLATEGENVGGTASLPAEDSSFNDGDSVFYGDRRRPYQPAREPTKGSRGLSLGRTSRNFQKDLRGQRSPQITCLTGCPVRGLISPGYDMKVKDLSIVLHQYEKCTTAQKSRVPSGAHLRAFPLFRYQAHRVMNPEAVPGPPPRAGTGMKTSSPPVGDRPPPKY